MMNWKRLKNFLGMTWFTLVLLFGAYLFYSDATIDGSELHQYAGRVTNLGISNHRSLTSQGPRTSEVFFVEIEGLEGQLAIYKTSQNYDELQSSLRVGDVIDVTFRPTNKIEQPNIDLYELKLGNEIIVEQSTYRTKRLIGALIALIGSCVVLFIGIREDRKYWKRTAYNIG